MSNDKTTIDRQAAQIAMLREALDHISVQCVQSDIAPDHYLISKVEFDQTVPAALAATQSDVEAWQAAQAQSEPICDCPAKDMPYGRCCKAPSAPVAWLFSDVNGKPLSADITLDGRSDEWRRTAIPLYTSPPADLQDKLRRLHSAKKPCANERAVGQQAGNESYTLIATGTTFWLLIEAADEIDRQAAQATAADDASCKGILDDYAYPIQQPTEK